MGPWIGEITSTWKLGLFTDKNRNDTISWGGCEDQMEYYMWLKIFVHFK